MKFIVQTLFLLVAWSAAAQSVKPVAPDSTFVNQLRPIPFESLTTLRIQTDANPTPAAVAANSIPFAPESAPVVVSIDPVASSHPHSPEFKTYFSSRLNRTLVVTEFLARGFDAASTHRDLTDPCGCYHEASRLFGVNMAGIFKSEVGAYSYSLGIAAGYSLISTKIWNVSRRQPRHARLLQRLSRALLVGDTSMEFAADIHNIMIRNSPSTAK